MFVVLATPLWRDPRYPIDPVGLGGQLNLVGQPDLIDSISWILFSSVTFLRRVKLYLARYACVRPCVRACVCVCVSVCHQSALGRQSIRRYGSTSRL